MPRTAVFSEALYYLIMRSHTHEHTLQNDTAVLSPNLALKTATVQGSLCTLSHFST